MQLLRVSVFSFSGKMLGAAAAELQQELRDMGLALTT
jgi:hypothetical protein